jgi:hypothetical protein
MNSTTWLHNIGVCLKSVLKGVSLALLIPLKNLMSASHFAAFLATARVATVESFSSGFS